MSAKIKKLILPIHIASALAIALSPLPALAQIQDQEIIPSQNKLVSLEGVGSNLQGTPKNVSQNSSIIDNKFIAVLAIYAVLLLAFIYKKLKTNKFKRLNMRPAAMYHIKSYLTGRK